MAIPATIIEERKSGAGMRIVDVRLVDGSNNTTVGTEHEYASLPLTLFFAQEAELKTFKTYVGNTPVLFMSLSGNCADGKCQVSTIKDQTWWRPAAGPKSSEMADKATEICSDKATFADVASLKLLETENQLITSHQWHH